MNLSRKWLNEFVDLSLEEKNDHDFAEAMTMSGSKVEGTHYMGEGISKVVVGKIVQMDLLWDAGDSGKHTLWNCKVDVGGGGTIAYIPAEYGMDVIDSGVAVLSMHSPWEVTSKADIYEARKGYEAFLRNA